EGNDGGIYYTPDDGGTWTDLSNDLYISQLYRLGVSATDEDIVITGLQDNGSKLYYYENWYDVTGGDGMECMIDYTNPAIQYATYANGTLYRTMENWNQGTVTTISDNINNETGYWVTPYIMHPQEPEVLYVGYTNVWKTTDRGNTFSKISDFPAGKLKAMAQSSSDPAYLYVSDADSLLMTADEGATWTNVTGSLPVGSAKITYIAVDNKDPQHVWVTMGGFTGSHIFETEDAGETWADISTGLPNLPAYSVVKDTLYKGKDILYVSMDRGVYIKVDDNDWVPYSNELPNVVVTELEIYYDSTDASNNKLRAATYGRGLWETPTYQYTKDAFLESQTTIREKYCSSHSQDLVYNLVNDGNDTLTSVNVVALFSSTGDRLEQTISDSIAPGEDTLLTFKRVLFPAGDNTLKVFVENPNGSPDDYPENDTISHQYSLFNEALLPYSQTFQKDQIPSCWTDDLFIENTGVWLFTNPLNRTFNSSTAGNGFAILDNEYYSGTETHAALRTPMFDFSAYTEVTLSFNYHFLQDQHAQVSFEVSTDAGFSWQEINTWTETSANAAVFSQTFTSFAETDSVIFRWNYLGQDNSYFALDDFEVSGVSSNQPVLMSRVPESVGFVSATLSGVANANGENLGNVKFLLGTTSGNYTSEINAFPDTVYVNGNTPLSTDVDTLVSNTAYFYKLTAQTGSGSTIESQEQAFSTNNINLELLTVDQGPYYVSDTKSDTIAVPLGTDGGFFIGNVFEAYISNADGDFAEATKIAELEGSTVNTMEAIIPAKWSSGTGYKIRVVSTNPVLETASSADFEVIYDNIKPKVEVRFDVANPTSTTVIPYTITADEAIFGLTKEKLLPGNATILSLTKVDAQTYQGELEAQSEGAVYLTIQDGVVEDRAQNTNSQVSASVTYALNTSAKQLSELGITLFPNPATTFIQLQFSKPLSGNFSIVSEEGAVLKRKEIKREVEKITFNLNGMGAGSYFIKLQTEKETYTGKFIKL
ncbi:MAG: T9SS type A sorting domain-containing protein, partial [Bacteroidota bacterium]